MIHSKIYFYQDDVLAMTNQTNNEKPLISLTALIIFIIISFVASVILVDTLVVESSKIQLEKLQQENTDLKNELKLLIKVSKYQSNIDMKLSHLTEEIANKNKEIKFLTEQLTLNQNDNDELIKKLEDKEQEVSKLKGKVAIINKQLEIRGTKK